MLDSELLARIVSYLPQLIDGAITTLYLSSIALACGFFIGVLVHLLATGNSRLLRGFAHIFVSIFRGTPVLAQLLVLYYVPSAMGVTIPGVVAAAIGLSLNTAAYQSQILGAGFKSIPIGQLEAARTFNLTRRQSLWHVEIPQVIALTLPALISEMIDVVKASAVVSIIAVTDLMRIGQQLASSTYRPLEVYALIACFYLAITTLLSLAGRGIERHIARRS